MSKERITFGGREFQLEVCLECYPGETVLETQNKALADLLDNQAELYAAAEQMKNYLISENESEFPDGVVGDIFQYVSPELIFIPHEENRRRSAILCEYRFDEEHGLAIIFEDGKFVRIGPQDLIV